MDTMKFDTLSRTLSGATTRRDALRTFAAIGLSLGLGHAGLELAAAERASLPSFPAATRGLLIGRPLQRRGVGDVTQTTE